MEERAVPRQGMAIVEGGEVTSGTHSPMLDQGIGMGYVPAALAEPGTELTIDVRGRHRRARAVAKPIYRREEDLTVPAESYPDDLRYHPEHDWARIEGDTATLGITWYGQDALGELVHYEPPDVGATLSKDGAYGEVESVKAVSDLIAPLSGEVLEVNQKVVDEPETINEDPVRRGLARADPDRRSRRGGRADGRRGVQDAPAEL